MKHGEIITVPATQDGNPIVYDQFGVINPTPYVWPPQILEELTISFSSTQLSVATGNITLSTLGGERKLFRVIGTLTHSPSLVADGWRYIWVVMPPTYTGAYITTTSDRAGTGINTTHLRNCIGACQILGGAIASVYSGNPDNPNSPLRVKAPHAIAKSREGLLLTRISGTQIEVGNGSCTVDLGSDRYLIQLSASTKTITTTPDGWRYVFATYNPSTDTVDWVVDTSSTGANISASLAKRLIGTYKVNSSVIAEFINRKENHFEYTTNTPNRHQAWNVPNAGVLYAVEVPPVLCEVNFIFTSGLSANTNVQLRLKFSSPDNILPVSGLYAGWYLFDADLYSSYTSTNPANSVLGDVIVKSLYLASSQVFAQKNGEAFIDANRIPTAQVISYELIE